MKVQVSYYSRGGNTKRLAEALANELKVEALDIYKGVTEPVDVLFLGNSMYAFTVDKNVKEFVKNLNPNLVKEVVVFSCSASDTSTVKKVAKLLKDKEIKVSDKYFSVPGEFLKLNKGRPNEEDCKAIAKFGREFVEGK